MAECRNCGEEAGRNSHGILKDYCTPKCARKAMGAMRKGDHVHDIRARAKIMTKAREGCIESLKILTEEYHLKRWEYYGQKVI